LAPGETPPWELLLLADPSRARVEAYLERGHCYLAFLGDALVGEFVLAQIVPEGWELMNVAVSEGRQGQGLGKQLVQAAIAQARELGAATLEVGTGNSSLAQLALYQKCGFRMVGVERDFFIRHYDHEIIENGIRCTDMIRLALPLSKLSMSRGAADANG
jgi:ribosomal protein S18 acetylase RimI-like enzyme